jgi:hypothetical protein
MQRHTFPLRRLSGLPARVVFTLVALTVVLPVVFPQSPGRIRVHVLPIENRTERNQFDAVGATVSDTAALTLRLLGSYEISQGRQPAIASLLPLPADPARRLESLGLIAESLEVENVVFGEVLPGAADDARSEAGTEAGTGPGSSGELPRIRLAVFDRLSGTVTFEAERTPTTLFDIFAVTDELAAEVLSGFSGRRVAFGSIRITPERSREGGEALSSVHGETSVPEETSVPGQTSVPAPIPGYRVILDGELLGADLRSIDSILTGTHRIVITTDVLGEERVVYAATVAVEENRVTNLRVTFPDVDLEEEAALAERRRRDAAQAEALDALADERNRLETLLGAFGGGNLPGTFRGDPRRAAPGAARNIPVSRDLYLRSSEFLDPAAIREAALGNAALAADYRRAEARRLFAEGRPDGAVAAQEEILALSDTFPAPDLFGYREEISWSVDRYGEATVQRELSPRSLVPWLLFGTSIALSIPMSYMYPGPPQEQNVPLIPIMVTAAGTAVWNARDWDYRPIERSLRRYGRDGEEVIAVSRPRRQWEFAAGVGATFGLTGFRIEPGPVARSYGVETIELAHATAGSPSFRLRYWRSPSVALGGEVQIGTLTGSESLVSLGADFTYAIEGTEDRDYVELDVNQLFLVMAGGSYTRTGRSLLEAGLSLRLLDFSTGNLRYETDFLQEEVYEELLGGGTTFVAVPGVTTGVTVRFGRGVLPPWEVGLTYRLERLAFPNGTLADAGPFFVSRFDAALRRSIQLGPLLAGTEGSLPLPGSSGGDGSYGGAGAGGGNAAPAATRTGDPPPTAATARAAAEERWTPSPLILYADPAGALIRGARIGLEYIVDPRWTVGVHGRWGGAGMGPFVGLAKEMPARVEYHWPGVSVRRYQRDQDVAAREGRSGWYAGGVIEYANFDLPARRETYTDPSDPLNPTGGSVQVDEGSLWFVLVDGGYRLAIGRAAFLDLGAQVGVRFGEGYRSATTEFFGDGSEQVVEEIVIGSGTWVYPTLAIGTRLY